MRRTAVEREQQIELPQLHAGQIAAYNILRFHRFVSLRCGRRFGKTELAKLWIAEVLIFGGHCAWFAPQRMTWSEVFDEMCEMLRALIASSSRADGVIRLKNGGRLHFWSLENAISGRGRGYERVVIDEAAFAKDGDNRSNDSMMAIFEKTIKPTLVDRQGSVLVCSNSAGKNPDNFFYNICTNPTNGFKEYHATTRDNPMLPKRAAGEGLEDWQSRRARLLEDLLKDNDPLVYAQEYEAQFVDWSGAAFFNREKLLDDGLPVPFPSRCDYVFAVVDTAAKTGTDNDATAVTFFAHDTIGRIKLFVLDWAVAQIEGAILETWLPSVFKRLEELARSCGARRGSAGAFIEDQNSGTILLQQARRRGMPAREIESKLTAKGKDERAISVSGYVHRGEVKFTTPAFDKTTDYKRRSLNHLLDQVEGFRVGDKKSEREDDLLDTFCYGIAISLGDSDGF